MNLDPARAKPLVCGGLSFDPQTNRAWGIKSSDLFVHFKRKAGDRAILNELMTHQYQFFSYEDLLRLIGQSHRTGKTAPKYINDKIEALKKKLLKLKFSREELASMFVCDDGYMLVRPSIGKKHVSKA